MSDPSPIRILVVDDHQTDSRRHRYAASSRSGLKLAGEASNGRHAIAKYHECRVLGRRGGNHYKRDYECASDSVRLGLL